MKHRGLKFLSLLLTLAMVVGMMPGMSLTAYAEDTTVDWNAADIKNATGNAFTKNGVTLVASFIEHDLPIIANGGTFTTTLGNFTKIEISADYAGDVSGTGWSNDGFHCATWTGNAASVSFSDTIYGGGFTCDGGNFTIKFTIAAPAHTHSFTYSASGAAITATCTAGCPDGYNTNGITLTISAPTNLVCDGNPKTATISGYPSTAPAGLAAAPTSISYNPGGTAPTTPGTYTASFTWGGATASVSFTLTANAYTVTYDANGGSGNMDPTTVARTPEGKYPYTVESCGFTAPDGKTFDFWQGSDGKEYRVGGEYELTGDITLKAQWKEEKKPDGGEKKTGGSGGGFDLVFNIPGADNSWEYVGGYAPQQAYRVSLAPMQGGSAALGLTTGDSGTQMNVYPSTTVYVFPNAEQGYVLDKIVWSLIDGSASYDITEAKNFVMPAMDVVVYVTFKPVG